MSSNGAARTATPELVRQLVREVRDQPAANAGDAPLIIGVRARPQWEHGSLGIDGQPGTIQVAACPTPLAARQALAAFADAAAGGADTLVVLTDLADSDLGADVLGRLVRPRLLPLNSWDAVCQRFGVRQLDPDYGTARLAWMADALLAVPEPAVAPGLGVLSVDVGLQTLAADLFGADGITLERLLLATARPGFDERVSTADPQVLELLCSVLGERLGPAGQLVTGAIAAGNGASAVPAGLAARTVGDVDGQYAQARIEAITAVVKPQQAALEAWARAAELAFDELDTRGEPIVADLAVTGSELTTAWQAPYPERSRVLGVGFEARLGRLATALSSSLDPAKPADAAVLRSRVKDVQDHREARLDLSRHRAVRAELAARLVSWLRDPIATQHGTGVPSDAAAPLSLADAMASYVADGAWVDAARRRVGEGDDAPVDLAQVLGRISEAAHQARASGNLRFAQSLAAWTQHGTSGDLDQNSVVAVEAVVSELVAPIAAQVPVLLVVLDGCGLPQFLELVDQFRLLGLQEVGKGGHRRVALAALPTVTEASRTSLLCGKLITGGAAEEKKGLPAIPAVAKLPGAPAVVFHHRPDLITGSGMGLPPTVVDALGAGGPRLVAAVVNTIDDELSRGDFTREYRIENLGPLQSLLRAAADAGRMVVVTADHGHVLGVGLDGKGDVIKGGEGGDRWRTADREPTADEVLLRGPRVLLGDERGVLAPWHDDLRYSAKHGGYHGGATPDECLVPLSVFRPLGVDAPKGWELAAVAPPPWWDLVSGGPAVEEAPPSPTSKRRKRKEPVDGQAPLFTTAETPATVLAAEPAATPVPEAPWADALIASDTYQVQLGSLARSKPDEARVRAALAALHARGGVASYAVIAQATGMPAVRVSGFLVILARLLNVDGFGVLTADAAAQEVRLDEGLLRAQFLDGPA